MMLVSVLRRAGKRKLSETERRRLWPMITRSDNEAASAIYGEIGARGLRRVARAAGMRKFTPAGPWGVSQITAADQVRFFLRIDRLVPRAHRRYARKVLSSITKGQRWGIAPVARRKKLKAFFKGGWVTGITHQVALLERRRGGQRIAVAVLTRNSPSMTYGEKTIEGIAARLLRRRSGRRRLGKRGTENLHARVACELLERIGSPRIAGELRRAQEELLHPRCRGGE
jgi:hypothetical protein